MSTTKRKFTSFANALEFLRSSGCPTGAKLFSPSAFDINDIYTVEYDSTAKEVRDQINRDLEFARNFTRPKDLSDELFQANIKVVQLTKENASLKKEATDLKAIIISVRANAKKLSEVLEPIS